MNGFCSKRNKKGPRERPFLSRCYDFTTRSREISVVKDVKSSRPSSGGKRAVNSGKNFSQCAVSAGPQGIPSALRTRRKTRCKCFRIKSKSGGVRSAAGRGGSNRLGCMALWRADIGQLFPIRARLASTPCTFHKQPLVWAQVVEFVQPLVHCALFGIDCAAFGCKR